MANISNAVKSSKGEPEEAWQEEPKAPETVAGAGDSGTWDWNVVTGRVEYDAEWASMRGYAVEELIPDLETLLKNIHPEDRGRVQAGMSAWASGSVQHFKVEFRARTKEGEWIWVVDQGKVVERDVHGKPRRVIGFSRNLSANKRTEKALQENEERLKFISRATHDVIYDWNLATNAIWWNSGMQKRFGHMFDAARLNITWWEEQIHPEDRPRVLDSLQKALGSGWLFWNDEYRFRRADGSYADVLDRGYFVRDAQGLVTRMLGAMQDVTERKSAQEQLERERAFLDAVLEACPAGIIVADATGKFIRMNPANRQLWGLDPQTESVEDFGQWKGWWAEGAERHGRQLEAQEWAMARALRGETCPNDIVEIEPFGAPGTRRTIVNSGAPVRNREGEVIGAVVAQMDITERREYEKQLASQARLLDLSKDAIFVRDIAHKITYWNHGAEELYGYSRAEAVGRITHELFHTTFPAPLSQILEQLYREGRWSGELIRTRKDGQRLTTLSRWVLERLPDGKPAFILETANDITERKRILEALQRERRTLSLALQAGQMGVYRWEHDTNKLWWSPEIFPIFGLTERSELSHEDFQSFLHPEDREGFWRKKSESIRAGTPFADEFRIVRADGQVRWLSTRSVHEREAQGKVVTSGVVADITERKTIELALTEAQTQLLRHAEELERTVSERTADLRETIGQLETFSYSVSHDMRGPLRAMNSFAHLLQKQYQDKLDEQARDYLDRIMDASKRLDGLIQDVLQYSRLSRESLPLACVDVRVLLRDIISQYPDIAEHQSQIELRHDCGDRKVKANLAALTQVFSNLISNALKFVPAERKPEVRLLCEERGERLRVTVEDNGIGIAPEHQQAIFGVFQRLHGPEYPGTGIGLAIVKKAVERMGGTIGVESEVGKGSRFWVELDLCPESEE